MSISNKHNYKTFTKSPPASLLHCTEKHFGSFIREVPLFSDNGCSDVHQVNWPLYNIFSLISLLQQRNYQLEKR